MDVSSQTYWVGLAEEVGISVGSGVDGDHVGTRVDGNSVGTVVGADVG